MSGHTAGQFTVSDGGAATYTIPITVTPGTGGIEPKLSISYNNQGGNGIMGLGWSLEGLPMISRSGKTLAQDSLIKGVSLNNQDTYSLDGERLISTNGVYGGDNTEYRTEQNAFIRLKSFGNVNGSPQKYQAWTKSGLMMEFGYTTDSRIEAEGQNTIMFWLINKVQDSKGNFYTIQYHEDNVNGEYYPIRIDYTGNVNTGLSPYASLRFSYEDRPDEQSRFVSGCFIKSTKRLTKIESFFGNLLNREYNLTYEQGMYHDASLLSGIQECSGDNTCFSPTRFNWIAENNFSYIALNNGSDFPSNLNNSNRFMLQGDWDGNGMGDLLVYQNNTGDTWWHKNSGDYRFTTVIEEDLITKSQLANTNAILLPGDYNADGFTDILFFDPTTKNNKWYRNNADQNFTNLSFTSLENLIPTDSLQNNGRFIPSDYNGDGLTDIFFYKKSSGFNRLFINTTIENGNFSFKSVGTNGLIPNTDIDNGTDLYPFDLTNDGLVDLLWYDKVTGSNHWFENINGQSFEPAQNNLISQDSLKNGSKIDFNDFNADGLTDVFWYDNASGKTRFYYNKGNKQFTKVDHVLATSPIANSNGELISIDLNGDQKADLLYYNKSNGNNKWYFNDGKCDFSRALNPSSPLISGYENPILPSDIDGGTALQFGAFDKGIVDVFWYNNANGQSKWYKNTIERYHLIDTIINGIGARDIIEYRSLTDSEVYSKQNDALYPNYDFVARFPVVCKYSKDNGVGGLNSLTYKYEGAKLDLHGRGFRGFSKIAVKDSRTGIEEIKSFDKDYRFINAPMLRSESILPNSTKVNATSVSNDLVNYIYPNQPKVHYAYVKENMSIDREIDGSLIATQSTKHEYDDYGNVTKILTDHGGGYKDSTVNIYDNHVLGGFWYLGRLSRTEVHRFAPNKPPIKRASSYEYDPVSGLLAKEISEPDLPIDSQIVKTFVYDNYGNIIESHLMAHNGNEIEERSTYSTYDANGRFMLSTSNELGHTETYSYDQVTGQQLSAIDINNLTISYQYDGFGRVIREDLPDGNWTTTSYYKCNFNCPDKGLYYIEQKFSSGPPITTYFDQLDREIRSQTLGFKGQTVLVDQVYNERGLVERVSDPYYEGDTSYWTQSFYDILERDTLQILPGGREFRTFYQGLSTTTINPLGQSKTVIKNTLGQNIQVIDNDNNSLFYGYDAQGNMCTITDPEGNVITNTYDHFGRKIRSDDPDMGTYHYTYNMYGELLMQIDPNSDTVSMSYDALGRLSARSEKEYTTTWQYDTAPNGIGKLATKEMSTGYKHSYSYDALSRLVSDIETIDSTDYSLGYSYDALGRIESMTYPSGFKTRNVYNERSFLKEVKNFTTEEVYWQADSIDAKGQLRRTTQGNGFQTQYAFDPETDYLQGILTSDGINTLQNLSFTFNDIGHLTNRQDASKSLSESFSYDNLNRLTQANVANGQVVDIQYDVLGNITYKSDVGTYHYAENNEGPKTLTSIDPVNPNVCVPSSLTSYQYTSFDKVSSMTKAENRLEIIYGADRQRIIQKTYQYDVLKHTRIHVGSYYEKEIVDTLTSEIHYIYGGEGVVAVHKKNSDNTSELNYWYKDHIGSVSVITNDLGAILEELSYDAWGKRRNTDWTPIQTVEPFSPLKTPRGFTGHEHIDLFDLINMNGRIYDPVIGRFIQPDPNVQDITDLQNLNRYSYVLNNPLSYTDPSGFFFKKLFKGISNAFKKVVSFVKEHFVTIASIAVGLLTGYGISLIFKELSFLSAAGFGFGSSFTGTVLSGGKVSDAFKSGIKSALITGATAVATTGVGDIFEHITNSKNIVQKVFAHGLVQGASEEAKGGKFIHGFIAGGVSAGAQPRINGLKNYSSRVIASSIVGGTAAELGGGKFANGAISGAMVRMFNDEKSFKRTSEILPKKELIEYNSKRKFYLMAIKGETSYFPVNQEYVDGNRFINRYRYDAVTTFTNLVAGVVTHLSDAALNLILNTNFSQGSTFEKYKNLATTYYLYTSGIKFQRVYNYNSEYRKVVKIYRE